jgi:PKD repeat protein/type II secretory pathway component GspD/PulD (secretin)
MMKRILSLVVLFTLVAMVPSAAATDTDVVEQAPLSIRFTGTQVGEAVVLAQSSSDEDTTGTWTEMTAITRWEPREDHSCVALPDGSIVLMGGVHENSRENDVWRSTDNGATWTEMTASAGWSGRYDHTSVVLPDGSIALMGGYGKNDVWRSTDNGATWTEMTASAEWSGRSGHTSVVLPDGSIVLMGGYSSGTRKNDVWRSTDNGATWTEMTASAEWSGRDDHTCVVLPDGSIVLMGGWVGYPTYERTNDVWRSTDNGATWTEMTASAEWSGRTDHTSVVLPDGSIVLMGGYSSGTRKNDVWRSIDNGATWIEMNPEPEWEARYMHTSVALPDGSIVLIGGEVDGYDNLHDVWRSTDNGATWIEMNPEPGWEARYEHTSVALPDGSIVLMGGWAGYPAYRKNDVWRSTDNGATWTEMTASAEWSERWKHTSVALPDGSIVLMGGFDYAGHLKNDVWRSTDNGATWTEMTASAEWSARSDHTSVVLPDGSIVLMGGGNDVWRSTDNGATWTEMTASAEWSGRAGHTSVVLPDGSIVLMGGNVGSYFHKNDVWRSTDNGATWTEMTGSAEWSGRAGHTSVVLPDGSIVLMGGKEYGRPGKNDVWRSTDNGATWTEMTANAEWSGRAAHTSVVLPDGSIVLMSGEGVTYQYEHDVWRLETGIQSPTATILPVPYINQVYDTPTGFNGEAACSETSAVMVLAYHGRLTPEPVTCEDKWVYGSKDRSLDPPRVSVYGTHVCEEYTYGDTTFSESFTDTTQLGRTATGAGAWGWIESAVNAGTERSEAVVDYLELHDCDAEFIASPSSDKAFAIIKENIDRGQPIIARTYLGGATGHYVVIAGYSRDGDGISYFVNDPYGIEPYDLTVLVQHLDQPVKYTYEQMRLGESSRGLITVHPFLCIRPKNIQEKQKTTIQYDKKNSNTFADPLALSENIGEIIAGAEDGDVGSNFICLRFEASGYVESPAVTITDTNGVPVSPPASNLKVVKTDSNDVIVYWDGKNGEDSVNQANNPHFISVTVKDKSGVSVTSEGVRVWVGRPVLMLHGLNSDVGDIAGGLLYKNLRKEYYVETIEYNAWSGLLKYTNGLGNIKNYANFLNSEIGRIKSETGAKRVDIVAHSMGGLISRQRIEGISSGDADVGKLIMMGTPNHGALFSKLPKALSGPDLIPKLIMSNPNLAINQMNPGNDFLIDLNGGNSYWYDVCLYEAGLNERQDKIAKYTQYYVLAGAYQPTPSCIPPISKMGALIGKLGATGLGGTTIGDLVVPYYSAMIANPNVPTYLMHHNHLQMWNNNDYYSMVASLLAIPDDDLPIYFKTTSSDNSIAEAGQLLLTGATVTNTEEQNALVSTLFTTIDATILSTTAHYSEFTVNNDTDSLSCLAFWESGTLEIGLTDPDGILVASDTNETISLLTVPSPRSGVWNLSVSPVSIPTSGTNLSAMLYITHPLYATVVDDTGTYPPGSPVPIAIFVGTVDTPATGGTVACTVETPDGSTATMDLYDDGAHDDEDPDDGIYGNTFTDTAAIGVYFVNISASVPYGCETIERNVKKTITINSYPDLAIQPGGLSVSNTTPDAGDIITFSTTVENIGDMGATNASVIILDLTGNTPDIIAESTFDLSAGESVTVESEWKAEPGIHNITAQISPFAEFAESDYMNNADSTIISTNDYPVEIVSENITFANATLAEIPIWLTNQTDPGYYITTFLYNDTIISPSDVTSDDLDITILSDEGGEFKFNGTVTEGRKGLLHIGNISIQRVGNGGAGTNTTMIIQAYDSSGKPRGLLIVDRIVYLSPIYPAANFTADIQSGEMPLAVQFTDLSTGEEIAGRYWSFGDGTLSTETNPVHTYLKNGTYDVSLTVVNAAGPSVATKSQYIVVSANSAPPTANFTANITGGSVPLTVQFTDTSTGDPTSWLWIFGDGATSTDQNSVHTYMASGTYNVSLTVSNSAGSGTETKQDYITVEQGTITITIPQNGNATIGDEIHLSGMNTDSAVTYLFLTGPGLDTTGVSLMNFSVPVVNNNPSTFSRVNVELDDSWEYWWNTLSVWGGSLKEGEYTIYAVSAPRDATHLSDAVYATATLRFQAPTITAAASSATIVPGDDLTISGTATGNPPNVNIWIFGPDYYGGYDGALELWSASVEANGTFEYVLGDAETYMLQEGQYYVVVQHPVDHTFGVMADTANGVMYGEGIANVTLTDLQASDAVAALVNALDSPNVDDIYATLNFEVVDSIQPVNFTANITAGVAPLTVRFTDTSSNSSTTWLWTFGDGATSTEQHPVHTYTLPGNHTVTLSVDGGAEACTKPGHIRVTPILFGDATEDGEVNQADTLLVLQQVVGLREKHVAGTDEFQKTDVNQNGAIDVGDALFIAQYNVGLRDVWFGVL